jgi:hypothetical protein
VTPRYCSSVSIEPSPSTECVTSQSRKREQCVTQDARGGRPPMKAKMAATVESIACQATSPFGGSLNYG